MGLKIAYFVDGRMPTEKANGYQSAQMCQAFVEIGSSLHLFYPRRVRLSTSELPKGLVLEDYYSLRVKLKKKSVFCLDLIHFCHHILRVSEGNFFAKISSIITSYSAAFFLVAKLKKFDFDCLYIRSYHALSLILIFTPKFFHAKIFFELHLLPSVINKRYISNLQKIGGVITVTEGMRKKLISLGLDSGMTLTAHDAVDTVTFMKEISKEDARNFLKIFHNGPIASYVGKFVTMGMEKGIPEIIYAARILIEKYPNLKFYIVGGPESKIYEYQAMILEMDIDIDKFVFLDKQPINNVPYYLAASDILLMPHPNNYFYATQVSPLKLFEYMCSKRPIVGSKLPAIEEVLEDEKNALLGEPGNVNDLVENISRLLNDSGLAANISMQAYKDVMLYTWRARARKISNFIRERLFA